MGNNWQQELGTLLRNEIQLKEVSEYLKSLKTSGITQDDVREYLNLLRVDSLEIIEDRILEILDIVEGFCNPQYRVW